MDTKFQTKNHPKPSNLTSNDHSAAPFPPSFTPISATSLLPFSSSLTPLPCSPPLSLPSPCYLPLSCPLQSSPPTLPSSSPHWPSHCNLPLSLSKNPLTIAPMESQGGFQGLISEIWGRMARFWPESEQNRLVYGGDGEIRWFIRGFLFLG
ncbi:hypothetical protein AMTRI_Chr01g109600 [Amborella trichopoda]